MTKCSRKDARILMTTRNFPPLIGGMERLMYDIYTVLSQDFRVALVGPDGCQDFVDDRMPFAACAVTPVFRFLFQCQANTYRLAKQMRPHLVFAGSGLTAPMAFLASKRVGAVSVCYLHGLDIIVPNSYYRMLFHPIIRRVDCVIANSHNTRRLAEDIGVGSDKIHIVHPCVDLPTQFSEKNCVQE
ncbi:MAG: glycosyltransferase family 4 protein, partial [Gammaproteobacteria bacterium]|nr:glycosyltransferase family 4 protein [Gammaproteobacteria bacterium]